MMSRPSEMKLLVAYPEEIEGDEDPFETELSAEEADALGLPEFETEILDAAEKGGVRVPFVFSCGVFNIIGCVCVEAPVKDSYIKGVAVPGGKFRIDRHKTRVEFSPTGDVIDTVKVRIVVDFKRERVFWQLGTPRFKVYGFCQVKRYWHWSGENLIFSF